MVGAVRVPRRGLGLRSKGSSSSEEFPTGCRILLGVAITRVP